MRVTRTEKRETSVTITTDVLCNKCGGSCVSQEWRSQVSNGADVAGYVEGLTNASVSGGYGSRYLLDMTTYAFSICERCLREMFDAFVIPPAVGAYGGYACEPADDGYAAERASWAWHKAQWDQTSENRAQRREHGMCHDATCDEIGTMREAQTSGGHWKWVCAKHMCHSMNYFQWPKALEMGATATCDENKLPLPYMLFDGKTGDLGAVHLGFDGLPAVMTEHPEWIIATDTITVAFHRHARTKITGFAPTRHRHFEEECVASGLRRPIVALMSVDGRVPLLMTNHEAERASEHDVHRNRADVFAVLTITSDEDPTAPGEKGRSE